MEKKQSQASKQQTVSSKSEKGQSLTAQLGIYKSVISQSDTQVYEAIRAALTEARTSVVVAANTAMVGVYWEIGRQISEAIGERAEYGRGLLAYLSERLTVEFGKGFTVVNLRNMRQFYQVFPNRYALRSELSWSHYRLLMRIEEPKQREFYLSESADSGWTSRQLERQINSFYSTFPAPKHALNLEKSI